MYINFTNARRLFVVLMLVLVGLMWCLGWVSTKYGSFTAFLLTLSGLNRIILTIPGFNAYFMIYKAFSAGSSRNDAETSLEAFKKDKKEWPFVTVQLPIYNERYVIERLMRKCIKLDYPHELLEIQVLDDSTDGTTKIVKETIAQLRHETDISIKHLTRQSRTHFKAGALAQGTASAKGEFLAIFDADFMPDPDFLRLTIPRFYIDKRIGCVQCRWGHYNIDHSMFVQLQAVGHDGHFVIEQHGKSKGGLLLNFNGTGGVWRRECIQKAGDWSGDTLAEDLDLSYRAQLAGWRIDYLRDVEVPAEVPLSISAFKKQQARWAKGSMQTALKLVRRVWDSQIISNFQKFQATMHLFGYGIHAIMLLNLVYTITLLFLIPDDETVTTVIPMILILVGALGPPLQVFISQIYLGHPERILMMPFLILLHHGLCLSNTSAVLEGFKKDDKGFFERTPKFGHLARDAKWTKSDYTIPLRKIGIPYGEISMAVLLFVVIVSTLPSMSTMPPKWLMFFLLSFCMVIKLHFEEYQEIVKEHEHKE